MKTAFNLTTSWCDLDRFSDRQALVDLMDGAIYELPEKMVEDKGDGVVILHELPVKDTPLVLMLGNFIVD